MSSFLTGEPWQQGNKAKVGVDAEKGKDSLELLQGQYHPLRFSCENQKHALHLRAHCYFARFLAPWGEERLNLDTQAPSPRYLPLRLSSDTFMNKGRENSEIVFPTYIL